MKKMYGEILSQLRRGNSAVVVDVIKSKGSTPRKIGARMVCFSNGTAVGTVGGGAIEHNAVAVCREIDKGVMTKKYTLNHSDAADLGMVCGGEVELCFVKIEADEDSIGLFEQVLKCIEQNKKAWLVTDISGGRLFACCDDDKPAAELAEVFKSKAVLSCDGRYYAVPLFCDGVVYIFGGGHIARALCPFLSATDFRVVVYEDNKEFAQREHFENAEQVICADFTAINENVSVTESDYAVVLTRGHKSDNEVVGQILKNHPRYLGVIGSRKKVSFMQDYLRDKGFADSEINAIHSPVGLAIGAVTPQEIAVSITAQLIMERSGLR